VSATSHRLLRTAALLLAASLGATAARAADEEGATKHLDEYFRGKITKFQRGVLTLEYDFSDESQMKDWYENLPFNIKRAEEQGVAWAEGKLEVKGSTGVSHVALFKGDVKVTCRVTLDSTQDVGGMLTPSTDSHDFATFTIVEKYFHRWDHQKGGLHTVMKYGDQFRDAGARSEFVGFRYLARQPPQEPVIEGRTTKLEYGLKRGKLWMEFEGQELAGRDIGVKLKVERAGFYTIKGRLRVDDVVIEGKPDPEWLASEGISPTLAAPPEGN